MQFLSFGQYSCCSFVFTMIWLQWFSSLTEYFLYGYYVLLETPKVSGPLNISLRSKKLCIAFYFFALPSINSELILNVAMSLPFSLWEKNETYIIFLRLMNLRLSQNSLLPSSDKNQSSELNLHIAGLCKVNFKHLFLKTWQIFIETTSWGTDFYCCFISFSKQ